MIRHLIEWRPGVFVHPGSVYVDRRGWRWEWFEEVGDWCLRGGDFATALEQALDGDDDGHGPWAPPELEASP